MKHKHSFTVPLANILFTIAWQFKAGEPFHLQKDFDFTNNQYNNFQKLKYWGFAIKYFENGKRKGGYWYLTSTVEMFFNGDKIPKWVKTFNNMVLEVSEEMITLHDVVGEYEVPEIWAARAEPVNTNQNEFNFNQRSA